MEIKGSVQELELFFKKFRLAKNQEIEVNSTKIGEQVLAGIMGATENQVKKTEERS